VHELLDLLSDEEVEALHGFLQRMVAARHPVERALMRASLIEAEDLSAEDIEALREAEEDITAGRLISDKELWRSLGHEH
jgi:hypothetical protein